MYLAHAQFEFWNDGGPADSLTLALRSCAPFSEVESVMRAAVAELDPNLALWNVRPMLEVRSQALTTPRLLASLLGAFSFGALLLAGVGTYGLIAYNVGLRRRDIGIRLALGARPTEIRSGILAEGLRLAAAGVALGTVSALLLSRVLAGVLFATSPFDPVTLVSVGLVLASVAVAASWLPAMRAMRWSPVALLRE